MASRRRGRIVTALDIGTTKICALQAQLVEENGIKKLDPIAVGLVQSRGMSGAKVTSLEELADSIADAVEKCQNESRRPIREVVVGIAGNHTISKNITHSISLDSAHRGVRPADVRRLLNQAVSRFSAGEAGYQLLHVIRRRFWIDDQRNIKDPLGLKGHTLGVALHLVYANVATVSNLLKAIQKVGLECKEIVLESYASSLAVLSEEARKNGVILLDIGGGTIDIAVFLEGSIAVTTYFPYGGELITGDLVRYYHTTHETAERLKMRFGAGATRQFGIGPRTTTVDVPNLVENRTVAVETYEIESVIRCRVQELLEHAGEAIEKAGLERESWPTGIVLTGGGSELVGIAEAAQSILRPTERTLVRVSVGIGKPICLYHSHNINRCNSPKHATAVGLAYYALCSESISAGSPAGPSWLDSVARFLRRVIGA